MLVNGKRGKKGNGFKLQDNHQTNQYYIFVWDKNTYDSDEVKRVREYKKKVKGDQYKGYGRVDGWQCLGNIENPETWDKLWTHLSNVYGEDFSKDDVRDTLFQKHEQMQEEYHKKLDSLLEEIEQLCKTKGIENYKLPKTISTAKRRIKKLKEQKKED